MQSVVFAPGGELLAVKGNFEVRLWNLHSRQEVPCLTQKDEQVEEFLRVTAAPQNRPIFIHCTSAGRVSVFWMIRRALVDNWKVEDAEAEAYKIGLHNEKLRDWAVGYINQHRQADEKK